MMKKAIITFGVGYGFEDISYFIHSCSRYAPDADIFLFVGSNIGSLKEQCASYPQVHLIRYRESMIPKIISKLFMKVPGITRPYSHMLSALYRKNLLSKPLLNAFTTPLVQFMVKRFFIIQALLRTLPHEQVMLTDIRDVILQADPFKGIGSNTIITGVEPVTNEQSEMNRKWIVKTFSPEALDMLKDHFVACAGVTIGSRKAIDQYVHEMLGEVYLNLSKITGMLGADQAIHIKLFYQRLHGLDKHFETNGTGSIATLHFSALDEFTVTHDRIANRVNDNLAVVHQYDRHPALAASLKKGIGMDMTQSLIIAA